MKEHSTSLLISHKGHAKQNHHELTLLTTRKAKLKGLTTPNVGKNVEQLELSYIVGSGVNGTAILKKCLTVSSNRHTYPMNQKFDSWLWLSQQEKNICLHKDLYASVHSIFIYNSRNLEATQMSINRRMGKHFVVYPYRGMPHSNKGMNYW